MSDPTPSRPEIEVSEEARASLRDYLSRSGPAQLIRVHVGHG
jgi:hypothetical protein